ncbi:hypothetical protein BS47DRAFT_1384505 [Hydnum rufescens UP504]|uniref:DUF6534 domain-containing protein n=1 Tax=Hydnum rufescens UP504 TaxID=1448309 RepID=A0A9P6AQM2_9AGAM|nr:hypothetical protein BS47DRAFT_1384505 [Hydnum rufescens UP504]
MRSTAESYEGIFLGGVLGNIIFGATTVQTILYFSRFSTDSRRTRALVTIVWILEALTMLIVVAIEFVIIVVGPHDPRGGQMPWLQSLWVVFGNVLTALVQVFYVWRLYRLSRNVYALFALLVPFTVKCVISFFVAIWVGRGMNDLFVKNVWLMALYMAADATLDLLIAGGTSAYLYRNRTGFKSTDLTINRLAKYSLSAGLIPSIASLISFIMFVMVGFTVSGIAIQIMSVRLHAMALLGNLHMRSSFKDLTGTAESIHVPLSTIGRSDGQVLRRRSVSTPLTESIIDEIQAARISSGAEAS